MAGQTMEQYEYNAYATWLAGGLRSSGGRTPRTRTPWIEMPTVRSIKQRMRKASKAQRASACLQQLLGEEANQ